MSGTEEWACDIPLTLAEGLSAFGRVILNNVIEGDQAGGRLESRAELTFRC